MQHREDSTISSYYDCIGLMSTNGRSWRAVPVAATELCIKSCSVAWPLFIEASDGESHVSCKCMYSAHRQCNGIVICCQLVVSVNHQLLLIDVCTFCQMSAVFARCQMSTVLASCQLSTQAIGRHSEQSCQCVLTPDIAMSAVNRSAVSCHEELPAVSTCASVDY